MKNLNVNGKKEILNKILDAIANGQLDNVDICEVNHHVFNTDYFIIGYYEAEKWLIDHYGIFNAIDKIKEYEEDNFGAVSTDLSNSVKVVNMLVYILGDEVLQEFQTLLNYWGEKMTPELLEALKNEVVAEIPTVIEEL